jgi:hypothetical protein
MLRKSFVLLVAACLLGIANTAHVKRQQVVMSAETHPRLSQVHTEGSLILNVTVSYFKPNKNAIIPKKKNSN